MGKPCAERGRGQRRGAMGDEPDIRSERPDSDGGDDDHRTPAEPGAAPAPPESAPGDFAAGDPPSGKDLPPEMLARLRIVIPGYRLLSVIGRGGQATVYKGIR